MPNISSNASLDSAKNALISHLQLLQIVALSDDSAFLNLKDTAHIAQSYPAIDTTKLLTSHKNAMWQMQFHLGKVYTTYSYSMYIDTPRSATSTNFDGRPMAGDIILKNMDRKCLSAYNNTNTAVECRNNALAQLRLGEYYGIEYMLLSVDRFCKEGSSARIYFDRFGTPYCGKIPRAIETPFKIILQKRLVQKSICILPKSGRVIENC